LTVFNCTALEEDPVKIYNWVRNTIEFIPSYGSIQGADYTLQHGKGNAFDTASLLIALLTFQRVTPTVRFKYL
jgi:transglutaminase-like putative cysteine protease